MPTHHRRTAEQQKFLEQIRSISPESKQHEILEAVDALADDTKAQMGRVFIARQAGLTPVHLCDYYPPLADGAITACSYIGVGFYDEHPDAVDQNMHRARMASEWRGMSSTSREKILRMSSPRSRYAGMPSLGEVLPPLVYASPGALVAASAEVIPTNEEEVEPMMLLDERTHALRLHLTRRIDGLRSAVAAWAASSSWSTFWRPERAAMLQKLLGDAQGAFRHLDENHTFLRLQVAARACMPTRSPPLARHDVQPSLRRFAAVVDDIRVRCDRLGIAIGD